MQILKASEDYLETMLMMQTKHGYVRSVDVAEHLGVTKPSVTYATKRLLVDLGVDPETAEEDACKMEHDISDQTFRAICDHARVHLGTGKKADK